MKWQETKENLRIHASYLGMVVAGLTLIVAIAIWLTYFANTAKINMEIDEIRRVNSPVHQVTLAAEELRLLEGYLDESLLYQRKPNGERGQVIHSPKFNIDELFKAQNRAKVDLKYIHESKLQLMQYIGIIDGYLDPQNTELVLSDFRVGEIKSWRLRNYIDEDEANNYEQQVLLITRNFSEMSFNWPLVNTRALMFLLSEVKRDLQNVIAMNDLRLAELSVNMREIDVLVNNLKKDQKERYSFFEVDVLATNDGFRSASLQPVSIVRINTGDNEYVDLKLEMVNFQKMPELSAKSSRLLSYRSDELNQLPAEKRHLVNEFWGGLEQVRLIGLDKKLHVYISPPAIFSDKNTQSEMLSHLTTASAPL